MSSAFCRKYLFSTAFFSQTEKLIFRTWKATNLLKWIWTLQQNFRSHQHELLLFLLMSTSYNIPIEYGKKRSLRWREIKFGTKTRSAKPYMKKYPKVHFWVGNWSELCTTIFLWRRERERELILIFCTKKHFCSLQFCLWNTETRVAENYLLSCTKIWDFSSSFGNTVCNLCLGGILAFLFWVKRGNLSLLFLFPRNFPCSSFVQCEFWYGSSFWKKSPLFRQRNFMQKATLETPTKLGHTI